MSRRTSHRCPGSRSRCAKCRIGISISHVRSSLPSTQTALAWRHLVSGCPPGWLPQTWALGAGFPEEEWLVGASALIGHPLGGEHVSWVLDELGRYVVQDGEGDVAVYRVVHQSLADHLRPRYRRTGDQPFDPAAGPIWEALSARYQALLRGGFPATVPTYLWRYAYRHAVAAGLPGLDPPRPSPEPVSVYVYG